MFCRGYSTGLHQTHNTAKNNGFTGRLSTVVILQLCLFYCKVLVRKITPVPKERQTIMDWLIFMVYFNEKCHKIVWMHHFILNFVEFCGIIIYNAAKRCCAWP